jgi:bacteriocin biosynthesis cyclodehydratase domain-containing protein
VDFAFTITEPFLAEVVRHLRPLLDGSYPVEELATSGGTTFLPGTILFVLKLLRQRGVLQEGEPPSGLSAETRAKYGSTLRFLAHYAPDAEQVLARLQGSRVVLIGDAALRAALAHSLDGIGVGQVASREDPEGAPDPGTALLVALARTPASRFFEAVNAECLATGQRWMRVALEGRAGLVGPTIVPAQTACFTCLVQRQATYAPALELAASVATVREHGENDEGDLAPLAATVVAQTALEVARLLSGFAPPSTFGSFHVFDAGSPRVVRHEVLRIPRCPTCGRKQSPRDPWDLRARARENLR